MFAMRIPPGGGEMHWRGVRQMGSNWRNYLHMNFLIRNYLHVNFLIRNYLHVNFLLRNYLYMNFLIKNYVHIWTSWSDLPHLMKCTSGFHLHGAWKVRGGGNGDMEVHTAHIRHQFQVGADLHTGENFGADMHIGENFGENCTHFKSFPSIFSDG